MARITLSKRKADILSNGVGLAGLVILVFIKSWWPGLLLVIWAALVTRQYLTGRIWDAIISSVILIGLFVVYSFNVRFAVLMPVLFGLGGIYIILREYLFTDDTNGEEKSQEIKDDVDNDGIDD